jgi:hypothetical protein
VTNSARVDDLPFKQQPRTVGPALAICFVFLAAALPLIAAGHERGRGAWDQNTYHLVAIRTFARQWPRFDLHDYASATTPGYHLILALVDKFISDDVRVLRLFGMLFTLGLLATLALAVGRRVPPAIAIALCLPAVCSLYVFSSGAWLLPDNVAWWGVLAILLVALRPRVDAWTYVLGAILLTILVAIRQSDAWAAAVLWAAAWRGNASENSAPFDTRAAVARLGGMALATVPAAALLLWFVHLWHGLLPVGMQSFHGGANPAVPATVLGVFGILAIFFTPFAAPSRLPRRGLFIGGGAAMGFIAAALPVMTYSHAQGRESGIWNLALHLPMVHQRSILMIALATLGGALLVIWLLSLETRDRWIFLITWLAFIAAQTENTKAWQRYYEPFVLIALPLMASRVMEHRNSWPRPIAIAGPLILALLLAAITAAGLH